MHHKNNDACKIQAICKPLSIFFSPECSKDGEILVIHLRQTLGYIRLRLQRRELQRYEYNKQDVIM